MTYLFKTLVILYDITDGFISFRINPKCSNLSDGLMLIFFLHCSQNEGQTKWSMEHFISFFHLKLWIEFPFDCLISVCLEKQDNTG